MLRYYVTYSTPSLGFILLHILFGCVLYNFVNTRQELNHALKKIQGMFLPMFINKQKTEKGVVEAKTLKVFVVFVDRMQDYIYNSFALCQRKEHVLLNNCEAQNMPFLMIFNCLLCRYKCQWSYQWNSILKLYMNCLLMNAISDNESAKPQSSCFYVLMQDYDPLAEHRIPKISDREDEYRARRRNMIISPERYDPFAEG